MCMCETYPERFEGLCVRQKLEQRGRGEQQKRPVDGFSALQTGQRELVEAVARLVPHCRLKTTMTTENKLMRKNAGRTRAMTGYGWMRSSLNCSQSYGSCHELTSGTSRVSFFSQSWRCSLSARLDFTVDEQ